MGGYYRRWILALLSVFVIALAVIGVSTGGQARPSVQTDSFQPGSPEPGTDIPQTTVRLGMRPVANDTIYVIGIKQGWYKDVGISIAPPPYGNKSTFDNAIPLLINKQIDIEGLDPIPTIPTLKTVHDIRFIALSDLFQGFQILAAPGTHAKTLSAFVKQGLPFKTALKKTLDQMQGKTFTIPPVVGDRPFLHTAFSSAGLDYTKFTHVIVTPDSNMVALASGGKTDFVSPDGAPFTAQFLGSGWIPIVTPLELAAGLPGGVSSPAEVLVEPPGLASNISWIQDNPNTVLRFVSVMFRIIDAEQKDPAKQLAFELPFINAFAGTHLTLKQLQYNIDSLDPLSNFAFQRKYCDGKNPRLYYKNWYRANVNLNIKLKTLPQGTYNPDDLIWSCQIYNTLLSYKNKSDSLLAKAGGAANQNLVNKAKTYYRRFDYLDSYRLLKAAVKP
jgi:ABC-type nitrate/sulfonate/bicarbonate transport system substrate-binding protein